MTNVREWIGTAVERIRAFAYGAPQEHGPRRPRVGLALGGGFARGVAHIGVLRALERAHIPIDYIAGTSVGALIGVAYASGTSTDEMERQAAKTTFRDFGKWTFSLRGMATNLRLENLLHRLTAATKFEELTIPTVIVATDLKKGETAYFDRGELGAPLRASCAYPGLFLPVEYDGKTLVDGFLTAQVPTEAARRMGAELVIAVHLETGEMVEDPKTVVDVIGRSFSILQRASHETWRTHADIILEPDVHQFLWDDFAKTRQMVAAGEAATVAALPEIRAALAPQEAEKAPA